MKITKHAQSCVLVETKGKRILIDPGSFVFNTEFENKKARDFKKIDHVVITHEHQDHFDLEEVTTIIDKNKSKAYSTRAVLKLIKAELPKAKTELFVDGTHADLGDGVTVEFYKSEHGPLPTGDNPPEVYGVVVGDGETRIYAPGDTLYFSPWAHNIDVVFAPICGHVTMNIDEAKAETIKLNPKIVIPYHYDSPRFPADPEDFTLAMKDVEIGVKILKKGESINL